MKTIKKHFKFVNLLIVNANIFLNQEPILRLLNLQLGTTLALFKVSENIFDFKTHKATRGVENLYNAGVVHNSKS
jgi:hypothetical protein